MLRDIYENPFQMNVIDTSSINVLDNGYIITNDGFCIRVENDMDHCIVFSEFLNKYLNENENRYYQSTEAASKIAKLGHIAYFGIRPSDMKGDLRSDNKGFGVFFLPDPIDNLTDKQKETLKVLIDTNYSSLFGNEKLSLTFGNGVTGKEYDHNLVMSIINGTKKII